MNKIYVVTVHFVGGNNKSFAMDSGQTNMFLEAIREERNILVPYEDGSGEMFVIHNITYVDVVAS